MDNLMMYERGAVGDAAFLFLLPFGPTNGEPQQAKVDKQDSTIPPEREYIVLYIEDNPFNMKLIERILLQLPNTTLLSASNGLTGLELALARLPDIVLLDLHLPDIQGEVVLAQLLGDPRTRHIPVIVISADAMPQQIERLTAAGARKYLTKPLDITLFISVLNEVLGPARGNTPNSCA